MTSTNNNEEANTTTTTNDNNDNTTRTVTAASSEEKVDPNAIVPQLESHNITEADLQIAIRVLNAVASLDPRRKKRKHNSNHQNHTELLQKGLEQYKQSNLRPFRKALAGCLELHKRTMFEGREEEEHYEQRLAARSLKRQKSSERDMQRKHIASTALRRGRIERLQALKEEAKEEELEKMAQMIADGHVDTNGAATAANTTVPMLTANGEGENASNEGDAGTTKLPKLRSCYVCKTRYRELHHFYDQLCPTCAPLNWEKRHQSVDMRGKVAVVTGSRVKIGYQTSLKLLRAGCSVVATTRFPNAAAAVYREEADFEEWKDQLQVYGLDLRDIIGIEAFTRFLKMRYPGGVDILINNACQTVRRPAAYYRPIIEKEEDLWRRADDTHKAMLTGCREFEKLRRRQVLMDQGEQSAALGPHTSQTQHPVILGSATSSTIPTSTSAVVVASTTNDSTRSSSLQTTQAPSAEIRVPFEETGLSHSAAMSQMTLLPEDAGLSESILPTGITDINGQQLDLRTSNSWLLKMEQVSTPEIMECMLINAIAPFVLNSRLKPLMTTPNTPNRPDRYIINVSAMEGKFYRYKMPNHPHTNMAKAALNMLTRTSAEDLAKQHRIFMNSVDTGWINDENPLSKASQTAINNDFQTPIDEIDAAARILDPIFVGIKTESNKEKPKDYGKFLKDYFETEW